MRRVIFSILWIGLLLGPAAADAAIYGWQDLQGVAHYVSDPEDVPPEYRTQAITVVKDIPLPPLLAASPENPAARTEEAASPAPSRVSDPSRTELRMGVPRRARCRGGRAAEPSGLVDRAERSGRGVAPAGVRIPVWDCSGPS